MTESDRRSVPLVQRAYDRIWWLAVAAFLFWAVVYVVWGTLDVLSVPPG